MINKKNLFEPMVGMLDLLRGSGVVDVDKVMDEIVEDMTSEHMKGEGVLVVEKTVTGRTSDAVIEQGIKAIRNGAMWVLDERIDR